MNKCVVLLFLAMFLTACGKNDSESSLEQENTPKVEIKLPHKTVAGDLLKTVATNPALFHREFKKFSKAEKYYFCAAFTMGAMSVAKPVTASAMVNYFIGLGVVDNNQGIDDVTYRAFDFGKNIFYFEPVVNIILHDQICENIIGQASKTAKKKNISTKEINKIGKVEVRKIVSYIKKK